MESACVGVLSIIELKNARWNIDILNSFVFHYNRGYANAPRCYAIHILPALSLVFAVSICYNTDIIIYNTPQLFPSISFPTLQSQSLCNFTVRKYKQTLHCRYPSIRSFVRYSHCFILILCTKYVYTGGRYDVAVQY